MLLVMAIRQVERSISGSHGLRRRLVAHELLEDVAVENEKRKRMIQTNINIVPQGNI